jgi:hypothetical protein
MTFSGGGRAADRGARGLEIEGRLSRGPALGIALVAAMAALSAAALTLDYRYPKQDFEGRCGLWRHKKRRASRR